jgi:predicted esterase
MTRWLMVVLFAVGPWDFSGCAQGDIDSPGLEEKLDNEGSGEEPVGVPDGGAGQPDADGGDETEPMPIDFLPEPTGVCPEFADGTVTFSPAGIPPRDVLIFMADLQQAQAEDGPLVFYWHGMGSRPQAVSFGLGSGTIEEIRQKGGIVAAPYHDAAAGTLPWYLATGASNKEDDLILADEILACAMEKVGIDPRRIHALGMSAGGLQTTQMSYRRSGYLASVVTYSGGLMGSVQVQDEDNKFAAMIFHGGESDIVIVHFDELSDAYHGDLTDTGHFAIMCNHGAGHSIPTDARNSVWQFFLDHPYGTDPSPYEAGLPTDFPSYCGP